MAVLMLSDDTVVAGRTGTADRPGGGAFRQALRDPRRKDVETLARAVDRKVMQPVRALAGDATEPLISPDGALNLIPFQALDDEQGRYLVERYSTSFSSMILTITAN